jgi:hypothetical protein|tara:strand:+ start:146 stop:562 length:417 start_codon:yes stop_codon:yes gene_type:complete
MVAALAAVGAAKAAPKPSAENAMGYLLAGVVALWLLKSAAGKVLDPLADIGGAVVTGTRAVVHVGDELTGGIQGDPRKLSYWTEYDIPFTDTSIPLVNVKEPGQSWMEYTTTFDFPGLPEYNVMDTPGKIGGLFKKVF